MENRQQKRDRYLLTHRYTKILRYYGLRTRLEKIRAIRKAKLKKENLKKKKRIRWEAMSIFFTVKFVDYLNYMGFLW